jgi:hypothetical protein
MKPFKFSERIAKLTAAQVGAVLGYDAETGLLRWKVATSNRVRVGAVAGKLSRDGYLRLSVFGCQVKAHRIAWLLQTGAWPSADIDHIDGDRSNNAFANLRDVSRQVNLQNRRVVSARKTSSSLLGVHKARNESNPWGASITLPERSRKKHLGYFPTEEAAHAAYLQAKRRVHVGCTA